MGNYSNCSEESGQEPMTPDFINGSFEIVAGLLIWMNVRRLHKDKKVRGVSIVPMYFFMLWGYWNLYYYPSLNQWWSFVGGVAVVIANTVWVAQMIYWNYKEKGEKA